MKKVRVPIVEGKKKLVVRPLCQRSLYSSGTPAVAPTSSKWGMGSRDSSNILVAVGCDESELTEDYCVC